MEGSSVSTPALDQVLGTAIGTVGAVAAVFLTDWLRNLRKARREIPARLRSDHTYAESRASEIQRAMEPDAQGSYTATKAMRFDVASYQRLASEAFYQLTSEQRKALANIVFAMSDADAANAEALKLVDGAGTIAVGLIAFQNWARREVFLLSRVRDLIDGYLAGVPSPVAPARIQALRIFGHIWLVFLAAAIWTGAADHWLSYRWLMSGYASLDYDPLWAKFRYTSMAVAAVPGVASLAWAYVLARRRKHTINSKRDAVDKCA